MHWIILGAAIIGLSLGLLGSGGSILTVPILTYLLDMPEKTAVASSLAIVGGISLIGALPLLRRGLVDGRALLAFGPPPGGAGAVWQMSEARDLREAAARLFAGLRWLDAEGQRRGLRGIAAMPVPAEGLGAAINDRLERAAAPR